MNHCEKHEITVLGRTKWRGKEKRFGIKQADRRSHLYLVGKTGTGKSTLMETMARQDIAAGRGLALVDPHGDLVERLVAWLPEERRRDLIYFDLTDRENVLGFNPLSGVAVERRPLVASNVLEVLKMLWADSWGPRLEYILRHALLATLDQPEAGFAQVLRLLTDRRYRKRAGGRVANPEVREFWLNEFESYPKRLRGEAISPIQNKVGAYITHPVLQEILGRQVSDFHLRSVMDEQKILLVNLAKGQVGHDTAVLLGALLVTQIGLEALGRSEAPEDERPEFHVYLDEFHNFTTRGVATMLAELRKYRVSLTLAHQHLAQLEEEVQEAALGNVGTTVAFRVGPEDAYVLEREFAPDFSASDLTRLPNYHTYVKLMVDGRVTPPFSATTLPPQDKASTPPG